MTDGNGLTARIDGIVRVVLLSVIFVGPPAGFALFHFYLPSFAMCRGLACLDPYRLDDGSTYRLDGHRCFEAAEPTGIGIFSNRTYGGIARSALAREYLVLDRWFLFIHTANPDERVIVIDGGRHVRRPLHTASFCATDVLLRLREGRLEPVND